MKILYISHSTAWDGSGIALYNMMAYMINQNHEVNLITPKETGKLIDQAVSLGVKIWCIPRYGLTIWPSLTTPLRFIKRTLSLILHNRKAKQELYNVLISVSPDIVHTNVGPLDIALENCTKLGIPHVWHLREYQDKDFGMFFLPSKNQFIKRILKKGNFNIAITKDIFNYWHLRPGVDKVIYDGVFSSQLLPHHPQEKKNYILFTGRVEPAKGVDVAIEAFALYVHKYKNSKTSLLIAGQQYLGSRYQSYCNELIKKNSLQERVLFLGNRSDIYTLMAEAQCMIVASRFEGFGFITVEAMLNHCLVIGRMTGGTKEQIDEGINKMGFPIALKFNTVEECAEMIYVALTGEHKDMQTAAYEMVTSSYTNEIYGKNIEEYYYSIINNPNI